MVSAVTADCKLAFGPDKSHMNPGRQARDFFLRHERRWDSDLPHTGLWRVYKCSQALPPQSFGWGPGI